MIFPPQNAVTLINHVIYFGGNEITTPLIVLFLYAVAGTAVIAYLGRILPARRAAAAPAPVPVPVPVQRATADAPGTSAAPRSAAPGRRKDTIAIVAALGVCAIMGCLFATTYMSAEHAPKAANLPFGVTSSSPVLAAAEKSISLSVTRYPNETAILLHHTIYFNGNGTTEAAAMAVPIGATP